MAVDTRTDRLFLWASGLRVLDARSGDLLRTLTNMGDNVAVDERGGRVFVTDNVAGTVGVLDARSGMLRRTLRLGPHPDLLIGGPDRIVVAEDTTLRILDARTGHLLHTIPVGLRIGPYEQAVAITAAGQTASPILVVGPIAGRLTLVDTRTERSSGPRP